MMTKYGFEFYRETINQDKKRLINQLFKLLPMKENNEDWNKQLDVIIPEIAGLNEVFKNKLSFLELLSKLEGLSGVDDFATYRRIIFESISLLDESFHE